MLSGIILSRVALSCFVSSRLTSSSLALPCLVFSFYHWLIFCLGFLQNEPLIGLFSLFENKQDGVHDWNWWKKANPVRPSSACLMIVLLTSLPFPVWSLVVLPCVVLCCVALFCCVLCCVVMSCVVLYFALPCLALPCLALPCLALPYLALPILS